MRKAEGRRQKAEGSKQSAEDGRQKAPVVPLLPSAFCLLPSAFRPAVFLDRDGVINRAYVRDGVPHPPDDVGALEFLPGVAAAVEALCAGGFALVVVTNQPDVARGTQTRARVEAINDRVKARLPVLDVLTCYHDNADDCACRKPRPGLLLAAAARWGLDLKRSFLVGDRWSDIAAGQAAGCRTALVEQAYSGRQRCRPDTCVADLPEAAAWILGRAVEVCA